MVVFAALGGIGSAFIDLSAMDEKEKRAAKAAIWVSMSAAGAASGVDGVSAGVSAVMAAKELAGIVVEDAEAMRVIDAGASVASGLVGGNYVEVGKVVGGAAAGAAVGAATGGVEGMASGMEIGGQLASGNTSAMAGKAAGAGVGAAIGAKAGDGETGADALAGMKLGMSVGSSAAGIGTTGADIQQQRSLMSRPSDAPITSGDVLQKQVGAGIALTSQAGGFAADRAFTNRERTVATGTASASTASGIATSAFGFGTSAYGDLSSSHAAGPDLGSTTPEVPAATEPAPQNEPQVSTNQEAATADATEAPATDATKAPAAENETWIGEGEILRDVKRLENVGRYTGLVGGLAGAIAAPVITHGIEADVAKLKDLRKKGLRSKTTVQKGQDQLTQARDLARVMRESAALQNVGRVLSPDGAKSAPGSAAA